MQQEDEAAPCGLEGEEAELGENAAVFGDPNIVRAVIRISTSLMRLSTIQISQDHCNAIVIDLFTIKAV